MNTTNVRELVERWLDERVEIDGDVNVPPGKGDDAFQAMLASIAKPDSQVVTSSYDAFGDFIEWLKDQQKWTVIYPTQWRSAMKQIGFEQEKRGDDWVIRGIRLKSD